MTLLIAKLFIKVAEGGGGLPPGFIHRFIGSHKMAEIHILIQSNIIGIEEFLLIESMSATVYNITDLAIFL